MFHKLQRRWQHRSLQQRFQRHCEALFPFHTHLSPEELNYLEAHCFSTQGHAEQGDVPWRWTFRIDLDSEGFDASYLAPRPRTASGLAWQAALQCMSPLRRTYVLATTQALTEQGVLWDFDGVGWHITEQRFDLLLSINSLPALLDTPYMKASWGALLQQLPAFSIYRERCIAVFHLREHQIIGLSLLVYPADEKALVVEVSAMGVEAFVACSQSLLSRRLNHLGRHLLMRYQKWGEVPEGMCFRGGSGCSLVFV